jgi:Zn-dependent alcohol dehydrogenase
MAIPKTQLAATVPKQGTPINIVFDDKYPVAEPKKGEVLVKVLYTGVCQSGEYLHYPQSRKLTLK